MPPRPKMLPDASPRCLRHMKPFATRRQLGRGRSPVRGQGRGGTGKSDGRASMGTVGGGEGRALADKIRARKVESTAACAAGKTHEPAIPSALAAMAGMPRRGR